MLFWMETGSQVTDIGRNRRSFFSKGENRLLPAEIESIKEFINSEIDKSLSNNESPDSIAYVPGWHSPSDWSGIPLQAIYDKAYPGDAESSALWYGLITMQVMIERPEIWYSTKTQFNGREIEQTVYWKKKEN